MKNDFHPDKLIKGLHVGFIPDGGRRWAEKNNVSLIESYTLSKTLLAEFVTRMFHEGVDEISIYLSSSQNYRRENHEVLAFTSVIHQALFEELNQLINQLGVKIVIAGNSSVLGNESKELLNELIHASLKNENFRLNLCIAYNPLEEIIQAQQLTLNNESFTEHLWVTKPLDLVIRTGNANLLSNFLPLQSGYARIFFSEKLFNDLRWEEIAHWITFYKELNLKYGD
jgi:undecaprenyl diphosphate synthase